MTRKISVYSFKEQKIIQQDLDKPSKRFRTDPLDTSRKMPTCKLNAVLSKDVPKTLMQLIQEAGVKSHPSYFQRHIDKLVQLGLVELIPTAVGNKYLLKK